MALAAGVYGDDAAADRFGHVGAGVYGDDEYRRGPHAAEAVLVVREIGQAVEDEHRLQHHGRAAEDLNIHAHDDPDELQEKALEPVIVLGVRYRVQYAADEADEAAYDGRHQGEQQGLAQVDEIGLPIDREQGPYIAYECGKSVHLAVLPSSV